MPHRIAYRRMGRALRTGKTWCRQLRLLSLSHLFSFSLSTVVEIALDRLDKSLCNGMAVAYANTHTEMGEF